MKDKINVAELLKDCPKGMKLDCTMLDKVILDGVDNSNDPVFPIRVRHKDGCLILLTKYGQYFDDDYAKCVIFPKGKTTWKGFQRPFKDGDIVFVNDEYSDATFTYVAILKRIENNDSVFVHCFYNYDDDVFSTHEYLCDGYNTRFATEEEKAELFNAIEANGYKWNAETKTLEKLEDMDKVNEAVFDANAQCCDITNHLIKEETMEENVDKAKAPNLIGKDYYEKRFGYKIPNGYEFDCIKNNEIILKPKQPQYPKTFIEVLNFWHPDRQLEDDYQRCYKKDLIEKFQDLLYARDAYWKIAGEQMGLDKPWEPDWTNDEWPDMAYICYDGKSINKDYGFPCCNMILIFPTEEMRDKFFENFKDLIEQCKELL